MLLIDYFETVYAPSRLRGKSRDTYRLYRLCVMQFSRTLDRPAKLADLTNDNILRHLARRNSVSPATRNKELAELSAMWRFAVQKKLHDGWPTIQSEDEPQRTPEAWMPEDIAAILATIKRQEGDIGDTPRRIWWEGLVRLALDTGERIRALRSAKWSWLDRTWMKFPAEARKGGKRDRLYLLSGETLESLAKIRRSSSDAQNVFEWPYSETYLWYMWADLIKSAGLNPGRKSGLHRLRKTVASVAYAGGMDAQDVMDHSDRRTTQRYIDPRFVRDVQASQVVANWLRHPPKIDDGKKKTG